MSGLRGLGGAWRRMLILAGVVVMVRGCWGPDATDAAEPGLPLASVAEVQPPALPAPAPVVVASLPAAGRLALAPLFSARYGQLTSPRQQAFRGLDFEFCFGMYNSMGAPVKGPDFGMNVALAWQVDERYPLWLVGGFDWFMLSPDAAGTEYSVGMFSASLRAQRTILKRGRLYGELGLGVLFPFDSVGQGEFCVPFGAGFKWSVQPLSPWDIHGQLRYIWLPDYAPTGGVLELGLGIGYRF